MPPTSRTKVKQTTPSSSGRSSKRTASRSTLSELSQNFDSDNDGVIKVGTMASIDGQEALTITIELVNLLDRQQKSVKEFIIDNLEQSKCNLEIFGWSKKKYIPSALYDEIFTTPDLNVKQLTLRGRGLWDSCKCPKKKRTNGAELIDLSEHNTQLERLYVMRPFQIKACTLLDLIARSPNLKVVRFYGVLIDYEHHGAFNDVRFLSQLDRLYWPWCNRKTHLPAVKTLVKRNDSITAFYSNGDTTCDLLGSDLLPNLKHLSLILNESWKSKTDSFKNPNRYLKKIVNLSLAKKLEALELRTFKLDFDEDEEDIEKETAVRRLFENYQLSFWENIAKLPKLKFLAIYGAWELDIVARELARHGLQIEHLRTNLVPSSMIPAIDAGDDLLELSMCESIRELRKLSSLRSVHFACHENLANMDSRTVGALKELADLIWVFDLRIVFSPEVEELLTNIVRRGYQLGKVFKVKLHIETNRDDWANSYVETTVKFSTTTPVRQQLISLVEHEAKEKYGRTTYKTFHLWGIEQAGSRDRESYDRVKSAWGYYDEIFRPVDMFA